MYTWRPRLLLRLVGILALALLLSEAPLAVADPGDLDPSFDGDGKVTTDFDGNYDVGGDVAVDAVGRIVVVGRTALPGYRPDFAVARYLPDGSLDPAFGGGDGKVETDFAGWDDFANAVVIDSAGRIVVVGTAYTEARGSIAVARYNPDGSLDTTFDGDGRIMLNFYSDNDAGAGAVAIDGLGRIVVAGGANRDFAVVRLLQAGALDATFGGDGKVTSGKAGNGFASEVLLDAAGRILTVGTTGDDFALVRFNSDGSLDTTFGSGGATFTDFQGSGVGTAAQFDSAGRIVAGGHTYTSTGGVGFVVARYTTEGLLDAAFGVDGVVITDFASSADYGQDLIVGECDRIVMSGTIHDYSLGKDLLAVVRYMSDGELDTGFGDGGKVTTAFDGVEGWGYAVTMDEANRIIAAGQAHGDFAVARYLGYGMTITACKQNAQGAALKDWLMTLAGPESKSGKTLKGGCITWAVTQPGAYTVTEEDRAGWTHQGATSADFAVVSDGGPYCHTFVNSLPPVLWLPLIMR